jgi:HK97 family phage major capsid protein
MNLQQLRAALAKAKGKKNEYLAVANEANNYTFDQNAVTACDEEIARITALIDHAEKQAAAEAKGPVAHVGVDGAADEEPKGNAAQMRQLQTMLATAMDVTGAMRSYVRQNRRPLASGMRLQNPSHGFETFGEFLQAVKVAGQSKGRRVDARLEKMATIAGNNESSDVDGGFLAPPEFMTAMLGNVIESGQVANLCTRLPVSGPSVVLPRLKETSRANGSRYGGVVAQWTGEGDQVDASKLQVVTKHEAVHKLTVLVPVTEELMQDAPFFASWVEIASRAEMAFKLDDALLRGTGTGSPLGVLNAANVLVTAAKETNQTAGTVIRQNVHKMLGRLGGGGQKRNAVWMYNPDLYEQLLELKDDAGRLIFTPGMMIKDEATDLLAGRRAMELEQCSAPGTVGDIILADWSQYLLLDRSGPEVATSAHFYFDTHQEAIRITQRVGGCPLPSSSVAPYKGSNSRSPFVTLAARA